MERRYILNAIDAALQAGEKILSIYDDPTSDFQVEKKADNSPLTIADRKAHETICRFLADTPFPLLSEEGKHLSFFGTTELGNFMDCRPFGRYEGVHQEER